MKIPAINFLLITIVLSSCSPKITTTIIRTYPPLDMRQEVTVIGISEPVPGSYEELGSIRIGDTGFSVNCTYGEVVEEARLTARKVGGNAIKITEDIPPTILGSSCHRIAARILRIRETSEGRVSSQDSMASGSDFALLHIYRNNAIGQTVNYDLHLSDTILCRIKYPFWLTVTFRKSGTFTLWARTDQTVEIPLSIECGKEYYIRCGIEMGPSSTIPRLEIVDNATGRDEFRNMNP